MNECVSVCATSSTISKFHSNRRGKNSLRFLLCLLGWCPFFFFFDVFLLSKLLFNYAICCDLFHISIVLALVLALNRYRINSSREATATFKTNRNNNWRSSTNTTVTITSTRKQKRSIITKWREREKNIHTRPVDCEFWKLMNFDKRIASIYRAKAPHTHTHTIVFIRFDFLTSPMDMNDLSFLSEYIDQLSSFLFFFLTQNQNKTKWNELSRSNFQCNLWVWILMKQLKCICLKPLFEA